MLKYGDKVEIDDCEGTVVSVWLDFLNRRMIKVEFDIKYLPDYVDFEENIERKNTYGKTPKFKQRSSAERVRRFHRDVEKYCPQCDNPWQVTKFGNNVWYDCVKCNKKKEDLI